MNKELFAELCDARDKLCGFCECDECEYCIVTHLIDDAANELPENERPGFEADEEDENKEE